MTRRLIEHPMHLTLWLLLFAAILCVRAFA